MKYEYLIEENTNLKKALTGSKHMIERLKSNFSRNNFKLTQMIMIQFVKFMKNIKYNMKD